MTAIRFEKTIDPSDPPIICDTLAFHTHLSKMRIKHAMRQGAVWIQRGRGKMCRIRGAKAQARQGDTVALYYDEVLLNRKPPQAHLVKDLFDYSVWSKPAGLMTQGTRFGDHCALTRQGEQPISPRRADRTRTGERMHAIVGHCPHCGSPIYAQSPWWGVVPPPSIPSCDCVPKTQTTYTTKGCINENDP